MNPWASKTPEEKQNIVQKSLETKRRNKNIQQREEEFARQKALEIRFEIDILERTLKKKRKFCDMSYMTRGLTKKTLMQEEDIVSRGIPRSNFSGVYFLIKGIRVVYVGQSVNVFQRMWQHRDKDFDSFAWVSCGKSELDVLESLYIHTLKPRLNCMMANGVKLAPLSLDKLLGLWSSNQEQAG